MPLSLTGVAAGFVLFRLFDIVKPFPARRLEDAPGGWGIMLDDIVAGVYGQLALRALAWGVPWLVLA
jgi:phosphatidylglycerophosphatase A